MASRLHNLSVELEQWKAKHRELEEENRKLLQELQEELSSTEALGNRIKSRKEENEAMKNTSETQRKKMIEHVQSI